MNEHTDGGGEGAVETEAKDPDFSLVSNWNFREVAWADADVSLLAEEALAIAGLPAPRAHSLQERVLTPGFRAMDVVAVTPPARGTALALALIATERVDPRLRRLQVLVVEPSPPSKLEGLASALGLPNRLSVKRCECRSDAQCAHPTDGTQVLVHSPTASTRTTVGERAMGSPELKLVVLHRVDALLAADRPKIFALLRAKPPHVQLVITTREMTADILCIARDFMPPHRVHGERSPAVISMADEGVQVASYSLRDGRLESTVHVDAARFDKLVTAANGQRLAHLLRVPTELPAVSTLPLFDLRRFGNAPIVRGMREAGVRELRDAQKAHLLKGISDLPNALLRGAPASGKSTTAAVLVLRAVAPFSVVPGVDVLVLVPSVERAQKFKTLLETLGKHTKPSVYVCEGSLKSRPASPPSIVIGKPRQIRQVLDWGNVAPAELKTVVFAQVHEMLDAAYREDPREVLRSLPAFVHVLATGNAEDAAVVREIDEFFNGDRRLLADRLAATRAPGRLAERRVGRALAAVGHDTLRRVVRKLPEFGEPKSASPPSKSKSEANSERKDEQPNERPSDPPAVPSDSEKPAGTNTSEPLVEAEASGRLIGGEPKRTSASSPPAVDWSLVQSLLSVPVERSQEEWDRMHASFADFGLKIPLVLALFQSGLSLPRPLQQRALPALLQGGNLVIEAPRGAGKTTAVMIALLNQLDPNNDKLQAICMAQSGEEVLRDRMASLVPQLQLVVGACTGVEFACDWWDAQVLIGTGVQLLALLCKRGPLIKDLSAVRHLVGFGLDGEGATTERLAEIAAFRRALRPPVQTILVTERVTDGVLCVFNLLNLGFSLISTLEAKGGAGEEASESCSESKKDGRQTEKSDTQADGEVLDANSVRPELPPPAPTVKERQPTVEKQQPAFPIASAASSTRGSRRSTPIPRNFFEEFAFRPELLQALHRMGLRTTLSVQRRAIPALLAGRNAVVRAPAGLGTLGVYLLPLLHRLEPAVGRVQAIVVCQKRSTAAEIEDALLNGYGQCLRFKTRVCLGGERIPEQLQAIAAGVHVVVGVAQRARAIVESAQFDAQSLRFVVFDELDEQLRTGRDHVHAVLRRLAANVQLVFVQREESPWVDEAVRKFLADPLRVCGTDELKAAVQEKESELKPESNGRLPVAKEERKNGFGKPNKKSSDESTASTTTSSSERTLAEIDSRRTTARVETEEDDDEPEEPPEEVTAPFFSEKEEEQEENGESATKSARLDDVQTAPTELLAARLAATRLRGQLLENRLTEFRIYALEEKLGLAHGQPVDVLPPDGLLF
ncbi:RNA helicase [Aphelenchoides fujianensis]|nr:RNA helicase [Aphelenchoides fujianensis]